MNELTNIVITVISGVLIFILGQLFLEIIIKQLKRYKDIKAKILYNLVYYANLYSNPICHEDYKDEKISVLYDEAQHELRKLAAEIKGFSEEKWIIDYPRSQTIEIISSNLIGLSNSLVGNEQHISILIEHNIRRVNDIKEELKRRKERKIKVSKDNHLLKDAYKIIKKNRYSVECYSKLYELLKRAPENDRNNAKANLKKDIALVSILADIVAIFSLLVSVGLFNGYIQGIFLLTGTVIVLIITYITMFVPVIRKENYILSIIEDI